MRKPVKVVETVHTCIPLSVEDLVRSGRLLKQLHCGTVGLKLIIVQEISLIIRL